MPKNIVTMLDNIEKSLKEDFSESQLEGVANELNDIGKTLKKIEKSIKDNVVEEIEMSDGKVVKSSVPQKAMKPTVRKPCCGESTEPRKVKYEETPMVDDVYVSRPGISLQNFQGHHGHIMSAINKARKLMSDNADVGRAKIKYKPTEVIAYRVESDIVKENPKRRSRESGWLVPGPSGIVFFVDEIKFTRFFEMVDEELTGG